MGWYCVVAKYNGMVRQHSLREIGGGIYDG